MSFNKIANLFILFALILISACIEQFQPNITSSTSATYVIEGNITDRGGFYSFYVSKASEVMNPEFSPVDNCEVRIYDDNDNIFQAEEYAHGEYRVYIDKMYLTVGTAFKMELITPNNEIIQSDYDTLRNSPEIKSVYYNVEEQATNDPDITTPVIQFYMDYDGDGTNSRNVMIEIEETWKYIAPYPKQWTWDGSSLTVYDPPDYSLSTCWRTTKDPYIYLFSTKNFMQNEYLNFSLHKIENTSQKLLEGYSLLVKQLSMSDAAYTFYEKIQSNTMSEGGLYEAQPEQVKSNLHNISNPGSRVLGYFYVASIKSKRIYYEPFDEIELNTPEFCSPIKLDLGYGMLKGMKEPIYLWLEGGTYSLPDACVDCTSQGGTTTKPDFWPN